MPRKMHQQCCILYWLWQRPALRDLSYIRISIICNSWIWEFVLLYVWTNSIWAMHKLAMDQNLQICNLSIIKTDSERLEPVDVWIIVICIILHTLVTFPKQMDRCLEKCTNSVSFWVEIDKDLRQEFYHMYSSPLSVIHWIKCFCSYMFQLIRNKQCTS